jgi:hypothetical protein
MRLRNLQCQRNPDRTPHLKGIRDPARLPVKLLLYERSQGIATFDALKLGIEVEDHIGVPVPIRAVPEQVYRLRFGFTQWTGASQSQAPYIRVKTAITSSRLTCVIPYPLLSVPKRTVFEHIVLSIKAACCQHGHCNYHFSLWIDAIQ